jgi:ribonuclease HI
MANTPKQVDVYTDGACIGNPGAGGYGVVLRYQRSRKGLYRKERSGGFRLTTNNRMELMAVIVGLSALKGRCSVALHSDSEYIVSSIRAGLPQRWKERGWKRGKRSKVLNTDLWQQVIDLLSKHEVKPVWVKGHSGDPENERCDQLAMGAAHRLGLPADVGYEREHPHIGLGTQRF